jgi:hypothetical protein
LVQLASNFTTFFEKLTQTVEKLAVILPQYEEVLGSIGSLKNTASQRLRNSLVRFYVDLFDFFQAVARVFSKQDGSESTNAHQRRTLNTSQK